MRGFIINIILTMIICQALFAQDKDSWTSRFILSVNPELTDQEQKDTLNKLLKIAEKNHIEDAYPLYLNALAAYYYQVEKPESMLTYLYKAIEVNTIIENKTLLSTNYNLLSIYHQDMHNWDKALEAIEMAEAQLDPQKQPILKRIYEGNKAAIYFMLEDYNRAKDIYERNLDFFLKLNDTAMYLGDVYNLAYSHYRLGNHKAAEKYANMFLSLYAKFSERDQLSEVLAKVYGVLDRLHYDAGDIKKSLEYQHKKLEIAERIHHFGLLTETCERLSVTYENIGEISKALQYIKLSSLYNDTLIDQTRAQTLAEMESRYESKIKTLELQSALDKLALEKRRKNLYLAMFALVVVFLVGLTAIIYQKIKINKKEIQLYNEHINTLLREHELETANALLKGQDMERETIAEELHDRMGSLIAYIKMKLYSLEKKLKFDEVLTTEINEISDAVTEAAEEIRRISHNLSTGLISKFGLKAALEDLCKKINTSHMVAMDIDFIPTDFPRFDTDFETNIYRILQELTTNTLKHAKASSITIQISYFDGIFHLLFEDNGKGFGKKSHKGIGLVNIENRVQKLQGKISMDSLPGRGTTFSIEIPIQKSVTA
ncbi:tetratricopeptide repeat-containing sensor histidine kinase [Schleiferia thermophila]|uniref:Oxygen sensor histidine kinase NreB n=1 Tax=Schleiferia thermophila TaxID=884107 RepID=A0A369A6V3_9FLAO|nr:sensor histidine kinase [Schleiferia thermophila]RCX03807.1 histidine kinase/DNA gyrase B/HSP90-like ATPase [Schleiferia thermophila]